MGVFSRFRRRSEEADRSSAVPVQEDHEGQEAQEPAEDTVTAEPAGADDPAESSESGSEAAEPAAAAAEGVGIPKQQSSDEAADSETGESARK